MKKETESNYKTEDELEIVKTKRQRLLSRRITRRSIFAHLQPEYDVDSEDPLNKKLKEVFNLFDSGNKGEIDIRELGTIIRALGCIITEEEIKIALKELADVDNNWIPQHSFIEFMRKAISQQKYKPPDADVLLQAFKVFDPENLGYVMKDDIVKAIIEYGEDEALSTEEIDDMMNVAADPKTGKINYEHYMNLLIEKIGRNDDIYDLYNLSVNLGIIKKSDAKSTTSEDS